MNLKKLFNNSDAVSPVIGVILMVAITVILAAAIGSSVFGQGPAESAPQSNIEITPINITGTGDAATVYLKLEHLGGDPIHFDDTSATKVTASLNGASSGEVNAVGLGTMSVGDVKELKLVNSDNEEVFGDKTPATGNTVTIKIIDVKSSQLIADKNISI